MSGLLHSTSPDASFSPAGSAAWAADHSYLASAANAIARTAASKLGDIPSVKDWGAKGDNSSDDNTALTRAFAAVAGAEIFIPPGTYLSGGYIPIYGNTRIYGGGWNNTSIKLANGSNTNLLVDNGWLTNATTSTNPIQIYGLTLDGNKANNASGGDCLVMMTFHSRLENLQIQNANGNGIRLSAQNSAGVTVSNTIPDNEYIGCYFKQNNKSGFYAADSTNLKSSDWRLYDCEFNGNGSSGFDQLVGDRSAGAVIDSCRFFSGYLGDCNLYATGRTQVTNNNFELDATKAPNDGSIFSSVRVRTYSGSKDGLIIGNNIMNLSATNATAGDFYYAVYFDVGVDGLAVVGNAVSAGAITNKAAFQNNGSLTHKGVITPNSFSGLTFAERGTAYTSLQQLEFMSAFAFSDLPTGVAGMRAYITDSTTTTWGATITGSGLNKVIGWFNGTNWTVVGA